MDVTREVTRLLLSHPAVRTVELVGSRASGEAEPLSDWDFAVEVDNFEKEKSELPGLLTPLRPVAPHWDPLTHIWDYIFMLSGGTIVNLLFVKERHQFELPWATNACSLRAIDEHFWDWSFWLASKWIKGQKELVSRELEWMYWFLLGPLGVEQVPRTLDEAWSSYLAARSCQETPLWCASRPYF